VYVDVAGGVQFDILSRGTGRVYFKYQRIRDFPLYVDPSTLNYIMIFPAPYADWAVRYDGTTRIAALNAEVLVDLTQMDHVSGTMIILSTHNSYTGDQVPYLAPVTITGSYTHQFPFGLSTQLGVRFVGERQIALSGGPRLNSYSLLDASAEFSFTKDLGIFLRLNNILDQRYSIWNCYQELPFSVLGGITVKW
jgi:outer membrane cobalamin receptor